jgi:hypothetical protein
MEYRHGDAIIFATAGISDGKLYGCARIHKMTGSVAGEEVHSLEVHRDFVDEHEAIEMARVNAAEWIAENWP